MNAHWLLTASGKARIVLILLWCSVGTAIIAAPLLAAASHHKSASLCYLAFSSICHQDAERSFAILGFPWAVCQRCAGIYFGLFLSLFVSPQYYRKLNASPVVRKYWVLIAATPIVTDGTLSLLGIWRGLPVTRFATGFLFGVMLTTLLVPGIAEFIDTYPRRKEAAIAGGK
jgi:uncharacterized membrane protein